MMILTYRTPSWHSQPTVKNCSKLVCILISLALGLSVPPAYGVELLCDEVMVAPSGSDFSSMSRATCHAGMARTIGPEMLCQSKGDIEINTQCFEEYANLCSVPPESASNFQTWFDSDAQTSHNYGVCIPNEPVTACNGGLLTSYQSGLISCHFDTPPQLDIGRQAGEGRQCPNGNPIFPEAANKYQEEVDYTGTGTFPLAYQRSYNSLLSGWTFSYQRRI